MFFRFALFTALATSQKQHPLNLLSDAFKDSNFSEREATQLGYDLKQLSLDLPFLAPEVPDVERDAVELLKRLSLDPTFHPLETSHVAQDAGQQIESDIINFIRNKNERVQACLLGRLEPGLKALEANHTAAQRISLKHGRKDMARYLLKIQAIRDNVAAHYEALKCSSERKDFLGIIESFFSMEEMLATADNNEPLRMSLKYGLGDMAKYLLTIPGVRNNAAVFDNEALEMALESGYIEGERDFLNIVLDLLTIQTVRDHAAANNNAAFKKALKYRDVNYLWRQAYLEVIQSFLKIPAVRHRMVDLDNPLLTIVNGDLSHLREEIAHDLLSLESVRHRIGASPQNFELIQNTLRARQFDVLRDLLTIQSVRDETLGLIHCLEAFYDSPLCNLFEMCQLLKIMPKDIQDSLRMEGGFLSEMLLINLRNGDTDIAKYLLTFQVFRDNAAADNNRALQISLDKRYLDIAQDLLTIQSVRENAAVENNVIFGKVLICIRMRPRERGGYLEILKNLLTIPAVRDYGACNNNEALLTVLRCPLGAENLSVRALREEIARDLLSLQTVRDGVRQAAQTKAFELALECGMTDIAQDLFSILALDHTSEAMDNCWEKATPSPTICRQFNRMLTNTRGTGEISGIKSLVAVAVQPMPQSNTGRKPSGKFH